MASPQGSNSGGDRWKAAELVPFVVATIPVGGVFIANYGKRQQEVVAEQLGISPSLLERNSQDDLVTGVQALTNSIIVWVLLGILVILLLYWGAVSWAEGRLDKRLAGADKDRHAGLRRSFVRRLRIAAFLLVGVGVVGLAAYAYVRFFNTRLWYSWWLFVIAAASMCAVLSIGLYTRAARIEERSAEIRYRAVIVASLVGVFVLAGAFAETSRAAGDVARHDVESFFADIQARTQPVIVFSVRDLGIVDEAVTVEPIVGPDAEYHYRYTGLRLYQYNRGRYFLITNRYSRQTSRIVVLADTTSIRVEFANQPKIVPSASPTPSVNPTP